MTPGKWRTFKVTSSRSSTSAVAAMTRSASEMPSRPDASLGRARRLARQSFDRAGATSMSRGGDSSAPLAAWDAAKHPDPSDLRACRWLVQQAGVRERRRVAAEDVDDDRPVPEDGHRAPRRPRSSDRSRCPMASDVDGVCRRRASTSAGCPRTARSLPCPR